MRKMDNCLCKNKGADQLDSTIPPLLIPKISSLWPAYVSAQVGLYQTWSEIPKTGFLASRFSKLLIYLNCVEKKLVLRISNHCHNNIDIKFHLLTDVGLYFQHDEIKAFKKKKKLENQLC